MKTNLDAVVSAIGNVIEKSGTLDISVICEGIGSVYEYITPENAYTEANTLVIESKFGQGAYQFNTDRIEYDAVMNAYNFGARGEVSIIL